VITVQDYLGNTVTSSTAAVTISITPGTGTAGANISGTTTINAVSGVATFTNVSIDKLGSAYTLTATGPDLTAAVSSSVTITAGSPTKLSFTTQPVGALSGVTFSTQPVLAIQDAGGDTVTSSTAAVTLSITSGTGTAGAILSGTTTVYAVDGVASFVDLSIAQVGSDYTLTATSGGLTDATSTSFTVTVGTASKLAFTTQPVGAGPVATFTT
jgi:hypothetical protein